MSQIFPSSGIAKKAHRSASNADAIRVNTIAVSSNEYGILYHLTVAIDVGSEANLKTLNAVVRVSVQIGANLLWRVYLHPFITHTDTEHVIHTDLGPWTWNFYPDGLYSGVLGEDLVITVLDFGLNVLSTTSFIYSGGAVTES